MRNHTVTFSTSGAVGGYRWRYGRAH